MSTTARNPVAPLRERPAYNALEQHYDEIRDVHLRELFAADPKRGERFTAEGAGLYLDYSKNRITEDTLRLLLELAEQSGLRERTEAMFRGDTINISENRSVLHVALRMPQGRSLIVDGTDVVAEVHECSIGWRTSPSACAAASGRGTPASRSRPRSTSGSAARISGR